MTALVFGSTGQVALELQRRLPDAVFLPRAAADLADPAACAAAPTSVNADPICLPRSHDVAHVPLAAVLIVPADPEHFGFATSCFDAAFTSRLSLLPKGPAAPSSGKSVAHRDTASTAIK